MYDITMAIEEGMLLYKGRDHLKPEISTISDFNSSTTHETGIKMNLHTGTHLDAPLHMLKDGATSNQLLKNDLFFKANLIDLADVEEKITEADLESAQIKPGEFIILKTKNSTENYLLNRPTEFIYLAESGAQYLAQQDVLGVGIDSLGIERGQTEHPTHKIILTNDLVLLEGLSLELVPAGNYILAVVPLKIPNSDALPVRALLYEKKELLEQITKL